MPKPKYLTLEAVKAITDKRLNAELDMIAAYVFSAPRYRNDPLWTHSEAICALLERRMNDKDYKVFAMALAMLFPSRPHSAPAIHRARALYFTLQ